MFHLLIQGRLHFILLAFLLALIFAIIYWYYGTPEHFQIQSPNSTNRLTMLDALYFSLGTQTTIGYGDITARSQFMRGITTIQISLLIIHIALTNI